MKAAGELFLKHGYEGFSLRQVAEQIGYSPGTIYLYFDNKDDLLRALADEGLSPFSRMFEVGRTAPSPTRRLSGSSLLRAAISPLAYKIRLSTA